MIKPIKTNIGITEPLGNSLREVGQTLLEKLLPKSTNSNMQIILDRVSDLSAFGNLSKSPECRIKGHWAQCGDFQFQDQLQNLVSRGVISPNTMVIADTGHDIPMLAQLHKNDALKFNSAFQFKFPKQEDANISRISGQTLTWGGEISQAESKISKPNGLYLGLEAHRNWKIDTTKMPSVQELQDLGIKKIVYLNEASPNVTLSAENTRELKQYFQDLEKSGIEIHYKGVDPRHTNEQYNSGLGFDSFSNYFPNMIRFK